MEQAIKRAIEGGYGGETASIGSAFRDEFINWCLKDKNYLLDPLFWQALGKSEGWEDEKKNYYGEETQDWITGGIYWYEWQYHWHEFIDHLAEGKDADSFFNNLLK